MNSGSTRDGTDLLQALDARLLKYVNYAIDQLEKRVLLHLHLGDGVANPSLQEEYVTTAELAQRAGMTRRQFKRAFTEGPHKDALRALAIKRGVKVWRWPVKRTLALLRKE